MIDIIFIISAILGIIVGLWFLYEKLIRPPKPPKKPTIKLESPLKINWKNAKSIHQLRDNGMAAPSQVFGKDPLSKQEFAVSLVTEPILFEKSDGIIKIYIDITNVKNAIYTTAAKKVICQECFTNPQMIDFGKKVDKTIHEFLLSNKKNENNIKLKLNSFPLRWASGGIFPIIRYKERDWTPFFFRDIDPCGWNIPLGASENYPETRNPWSLIWREFSEEFLILSGKPTSGSRQVLNCYIPEMTDDIQIKLSTAEAISFAQEHIKLRNEFDDINLKLSDETIPFNQQFTKVQLHIISKAGTSLCKNVLVAINPFEIGIEAVGVISCDIEDLKYILDGEILKPHGDVHELVRMPVALISHDFLSKNFNETWTKINYEGNIQSSVTVDNEFNKEDIILYNWDIDRRYEIMENEERGIGSEFERYHKWKERFGGQLTRSMSESDYGNLPALFTPTSAKIASYYFANKQQA